LIVEVDGDQHGYDYVGRSDMTRTVWLEAQGYSVVRFWNTDVFENIDSVCEAILAASRGQGVG
jgi:very-short-patch-repair endonuclease